MNIKNILRKTSVITLYLILALCLSGASRLIDYTRLIVNSQMMTHSEVEQHIQQLKSQILQQIPPGEQQDRELENVEKNVMDTLINQLLILDRAQELKVKISSEEIEARLDQIAEQNPRALAQTSETKLREQLKKEMTQQRVVQFEIDNKVRVSNAEIITKCQEGSKAKKVGVSQILLRDKDPSTVEKATIFIRQKLSQGTPFKTLAKQYSDDPNAQKTGGRLGVFSQGQLLKEIDDVVFNLELGTLSDPVKTEVGYHLLYVYDEQHSGTDCSDLTPQQENQYSQAIHQEKRVTLLKKYIEQLRKDARIKIKSP